MKNYRNHTALYSQVNEEAKILSFTSEHKYSDDCWHTNISFFRQTMYKKELVADSCLAL